MTRFFTILCIFFISQSLFSQGVTLEGYAFEGDNRGFLNEVKVDIKVVSTGEVITVFSNLEGFFTATLGVDGEYELTATKSLFHEKVQTISTVGKQNGDKIFSKVEMEREPGYIFEVTIAPKRDSTEIVDAIRGATVEIYNNVTKKEELRIVDNTSPSFNFTFKKGNHYTVLIRKDGYMTKRLEAFINVNGCILCFDGIGNVRPAVTDNLTEGNEMGTLLANIEMESVSVGKSFELRNIYYSYNKAEIRPDAAQELDKLITVLRDNPGIVIELGSHTDSRGDEPYNLKLSAERATSAVDYLIVNGGIKKDRIFAKGYGESKLLNKCTSFVDCTEEQHAINRRTELKILDIKPYVQSELKTLVEIKAEEEFQQMLKDVEDGGQIQIGEDGVVPFGGEYQAPPAPEGEKQEGEMEEEPAQLIEEKVEEGVEKVEEDVQEVVEEKVMEVIEEEMVEPARVEDPGQKVIMVETFEGEEKVEEVMEEKPVIEIQKASDKATEKVMGGSSSDPNTLSTESALIGPVKLVPSNYNGFKIQIGSFSKPLAANNQVLVRHGNVFVDRNARGLFNYMIGDFESLDEAEGFKKDILSKTYPDALIVTYKDGKKVNRY